LPSSEQKVTLILGEQLGEPLERLETVHRDSLDAAVDPLHEPGQHVARADFDERPDAAAHELRRRLREANGRGQLVDEAALLDALESGRLGGGVLDVFATEPLPPASPFWALPNVIVTPHNSGFRTGHFDAVVDLFAENLRRFERGVDLLNRVDLQVGY
jgi:hypothetical protein